jgi:hypothetical protein
LCGGVGPQDCVPRRGAQCQRARRAVSPAIASTQAGCAAFRVGSADRIVSATVSAPLSADTGADSHQSEKLKKNRDLLFWCESCMARVTPLRAQ